MQTERPDEDWRIELESLRSSGVTLASGLTEEELSCAEQVHCFRFPSDLRSFLSQALPVGPRFPNWRKPDSLALHDRMAWPFTGIAFDIENKKFWSEAWGQRPANLSDALEIAKAVVADAPRLIPIYSHRYIPAEPGAKGNPVFSVYQKDVIYYGIDLRLYFACEFAHLDFAQATLATPRKIRFWTDFVAAKG